jgi:hypothetical protein
MDENTAVYFSCLSDDTDTNIGCTNGAENYPEELSHLSLIPSSFFLNSFFLSLALYIAIFVSTTCHAFVNCLPVWNWRIWKISSEFITDILIPTVFCIGIRHKPITESTRHSSGRRSIADEKHGTSSKRAYCLRKATLREVT